MEDEAGRDTTGDGRATCSQVRTALQVGQMQPETLLVTSALLVVTRSYYTVGGLGSKATTSRRSTAVQPTS